jgi:hypothetical protein
MNARERIAEAIRAHIEHNGAHPWLLADAVLAVLPELLTDDPTVEVFVHAHIDSWGNPPRDRARMTLAAVAKMLTEGQP